MDTSAKDIIPQAIRLLQDRTNSVRVVINMFVVCESSVNMRSTNR